MKRLKNIILWLGITLFLGIASVAFAINITVPSAPYSGFGLVSTTTGAYIATTTDPWHVGSLFATTTTATSTFLGNISTAHLGITSQSTGCATFGAGGFLTSTGADCGTGSGTVTSLTAGEGLLGGTITTSGTFYGQLGTSTTPVISNIPYFTSLGDATHPAKFANVATSTILCAGILTGCNSTSFVLGAQPTFSAVYDAFTHAIVNVSATTTPFGFGTTTPFSQLSVSTSTQSSPLTKLFTVASTTGAELLTVLGSGRVGVASSSPTNPLSVVGNAYFHGTNFVFENSVCPGGSTGELLQLCGSDNTTNGVQIGTANSNNGTSAYNGIFLNNDLADANIVHFGFLGQNSSTYTDTTFGTAFAVKNQVNLSNTDGPLTFVAGTTTQALNPSYINFVTGGSASGNERMRIDFGGNVGVGTTSPFSLLSVSTSTQSAPTTKLFTVASTTGAELLTVLGNGFTGHASSSPWGLLSINPNDIAGPSFVIGSSTSSSVMPGTGTSTQLIVLNNGNVGIASSSPFGLFSINANANAKGTVKTNLFVIGSTTAGFATSTLFSVNNVGLASTTALTVSGNVNLSSLADGCLKTTSALVSSFTCPTGTVTSVATGDGLSGGTISTTGTLTNPFAIATTSTIAVSGAAYFTQVSGKTTLGSVSTSTPSVVDLTTGGTGATLGSLSIYNPFAIATTSANIAISNLAYFTKISGRTTVSGVATSTDGTASTIAAFDSLQHMTLPFASTTSLTVSQGAFLGTGGTNSAVGTTTSSYPLDLYALTTPQFALSAGAGINQWVERVNAGGNWSLSTTTVVGNATSTLPELTIMGTTGNFGIATSSPVGLFSTINFWITSLGEIIGKDIVNGWFGRISPTHSFVLSTATTTAWTASTTASAYSPTIVMPFTGILQQVRCKTDSFLGVNVVVNGSNATPSYFISSTTVGIEKFTSGNTFSAGQTILANFGTTTTATATYDSCTFDITETQ